MTENAPSADDVLMGGGRPAAKFKTVGDVCGGKIVAQPQTHREHEIRWDDRVGAYVKGEPKSFPSGDPIYGITVDVQAFKPTADDDGVRRLWIEGKRLKEAVRDAVRKAGAQRLEVGGELWIKYAGDGESSNPDARPPKLWEAKYTAPAGPVGQDEAWGAPAAQPEPSSPAPAPAPAPAPTSGAEWGDEPPF